MNIFFVVIITHNTRKSLENHISLLYKIFIIKHSYLHIILEILKKFFALKKRIINSWWSILNNDPRIRYEINVTNKFSIKAIAVIYTKKFTLWKQNKSRPLRFYC